MDQKTLVFNSISAVHPVAEGEVVQLSPAERKDVVDSLVAQITADPTVISENKRAKIMETSQSLRMYCTGLVSNWLRRDPRLNGGVKDVPKTTGTSRTKNPTLKNLNNLLKQVQGRPEAEEQVKAEIEKEKAKAAAEKMMAIDASVVPEHLRDLL